ncbi:acetyltransferase [candidate division KSB3 bacterium]|uniref:Acetyltransferase n=1 Tax=candidate division KSB3 bacterium TaxID=2044937 RepID=A0A2G6E283_9BACT|nr:MAG: acetyltransferase [candidate division KSB3 bacterium]PIE28696.1 MAG: acetyltransferase [candidate division KSB3 bacterium]
MRKSQTKFQSNVTDETVSALKKYQVTVLGKEGIVPLLKFELIMLLCSWVPGALGFVLRKVFYKSLFAEIGQGVVFGRNLVLRHPHKIKIGSHVMIDDQCVLDAKGCESAEFVLGNNVIVSRGCVLSAKSGRLLIGDNVNFGAHCLLYSGKEIRIGHDTLFAAQCYIGGSMYHLDEPDVPPIQQGSYARGVSIGSGCWLGAGAKVLDGVEIGDGVIMGAGAIANKTLEAFTIAVGIPAKVIKQRKAEKESMTRES